jgi:cytosine/adenosine deaminase-related metal-dependent hydrolase
VSDRSVFTDDEWKAITEAPLRITLALVAVGPHGPISVVKEAAAAARQMARPTEHGSADDLIADITRAAEGHEARHDVQAHAGKTPEEVTNQALSDLEPAARALDKLSPEETGQVRSWLLDIAKAVAAAAKSITPAEQDVLDKLGAIFAPTNDGT